MAKFTDAAGREWSIRLTSFLDRQIKQAIGFRPSDWFDAVERLRIAGDADLYTNLIIELVRGQFDEHGVDADGFLVELDGDTFDGINAAIDEAVLDFFPKSRREQMKAFVAAANQIGEKITTAAITGIQKTAKQTVN